MGKLISYLKKIWYSLIRWLVLLRQYRVARFSPAFIDELIGGRERLLDPRQIRLWELGNENPNLTICIIRFPRIWVPTCGFFALFNRMLCGLYFADKMGFSPVVDDWGECPYEENVPVHGTKVVFEYYFKPLCNVSLSSALNSRSVFFTSNQNLDLAQFELHSEWFRPTADFINAMGGLFRKYIQLNDEVAEGLARDMKRVLGPSTLGVHFRGTDYALNEDGHPVSLQLIQYFPVIDRAIEEYGFQQIFLATDDITALKELQKRYPNVKFYKDVNRSSGTDSVHFLISDQKLHRYRLGYEVLRDAYTLAACDGLIGGNSQVVVGARIIGAGQKKKYQYMQILDNGINNNNFDGMQYYLQKLRDRKKSEEDKTDGEG